MISIEKINWLDKETAEAEVYLSDGQYKLFCFAHPYGSDLINFSLYTFGTVSIMKSMRHEYEAQQIGETYSHYLIGKLIDAEQQIIKIGEFNIYMDSFLPEGLLPGDFICLSCERIDLSYR